MSVSEVAEQIRVEHDPYTKTTTVVGPVVKFAELGSYRCLRSIVSRGGSVTHQLYVARYLQNWHFYDRAYAPDGRTMSFHEVDRVTTGNSYVTCREDVAVDLSLDDLIRCSRGPVNFKIVGKRGEIFVGIDPNYYTAYLQELSRRAIVSWEAPMPLKRRARFLEDEYRRSMRSGDCKVEGRLSMRGVVYLSPSTEYSREWYEVAGVRGEQLEPVDPRVLKYIRESQAGPDGCFSFEDLPAGEYILSGYTEADGALYGKVTVEPGGVVSVRLREVGI